MNKPLKKPESSAYSRKECLVYLSLESVSHSESKNMHRVCMFTFNVILQAAGVS